MTDHTHTNFALFREKVTAARRKTGHPQKDLADSLNIDSHVLSRKLHATRQAFLTHAEIKLIIKTLALWDAIATQAEALELLSLMDLKLDSFTPQEWHTHPLSRLEPTPQHTTSNTASPLTLSPLPIPPTSLIGREQHLLLLQDRLRQPALRFLTLRGTGGVGKTRLALEIARVLHHDFAAGVFFVPLAAINSAALVPSTLVQALHIPEPVPTTEPGQQSISSPEALLKSFLLGKKLLLVLDNVEQIPEIAPFMSDLLNSSADLKIIVTSRTVLHLYGEHEFDVPPLAVDTPNHALHLEDISGLPAVRLFVERAQAVHPTFQLTENNAATVMQICARLDGLPLAIELAAVHTKVLSLPAILQRLTNETRQSLTFLRSRARDIPLRHQTLRKTLDWSYTLLNPSQQTLFRSISVLPGTWDLPAVQALFPDKGQMDTLDDALEQVESLLDHSLVKLLPYPENFPAIEPRFYLLETIREYALEQLEACGERAAIQRQHAHYYLTLAEEVEPTLSEHTHSQATSVLSREQDNLRAALDWALEYNEAEIAQRLCGALSRYWEAHTQFREAHRWIDAALAMQRETPPAIRAKLIMAASRLALWEIEYERSRTFAQEALSLYTALDDNSGRAWAIFQIADTWHMQGEYTLAISYFEQCLVLLREQADWRGYASTLSRLGAVAILQGNFTQAFLWLNEALSHLRKYGEPIMLNVTLVYLGVLTFVQGDLAQSISYLREGLLLAQQTHNGYLLATDLIAFGCLLGIVHSPYYTARICSAAEALFENLHTSLPVAYRPLYETYLAGLQSQIDEATWAAWWTEGKALSLDEVCSLTLAASEPTD